MQLQHQIDDLLAQRASEWFEILKQGRQEDMDAFLAWCRKSPLHVQEFLEITWTDRALERLDPQREHDLENLIQEVSASVYPIRSLTSGKVGPLRALTRRSSLWRLAVAAALPVLAIGLLLFAKPWRATQEFATNVGEQRIVALVDSSVITMNTDSEIQVKFARDLRNIELLRGEAVFRVAHDPSRPFRVHTRAGVVQAVGTQFNVYDGPDGTDVAVLEGRVRLTATSRGAATSQPVELVAGEEAQIRIDGSIRRAEHADVERVTAWSKRRLKFDNTALEEIVREFNRYNRTVRLRLDGVPAGSHHYSGIFDADDPEALARFLEQEPDLSLERADGEIVIRSKDAKASTEP